MKEMDPFPKTAKPVVLLVDDSEDLLDYLSTDLKKKYNIYTARDGHEALTILAYEFVQLVVSDVMMPEMDGFELCVKIKTASELSHIPVILLTGKTPYNRRYKDLKQAQMPILKSRFH
ncbi:response regulator [Paraflavitalea speifideaquila]|uniref:response regulator n=1 Tax=Paraflavitalea speifideaquila TaxID=3076558 RepID=UPI0028EC600C|nr:response regulator [Paraflavitalea speifideiaquila]